MPVEYPDRLTITTPEGVAVDLALAGIGSRFMAAMLDIVIQVSIGVAGGFILAALFEGGVLVLLLSIGAFLVIFGYDVAFEVLNGGRTPGKRSAGLRVVRDDGAPVTFVTSAIRNVMRIIDFLPVFYGVGMTSIFLTRHHQRLGDLAAGTIVVRERALAASFGQPPAVPGAPPGWDTSAVTSEDLVVVRAFLARRPTLTPSARDSLAADLAGRLRAKVAGAPPLDPEAFLEALASTRN
jgi:uncharacterized RDD family membrane protein YckC